MNYQSTSLISIIISVIGFLILLPLSITVFFEPKKNYSRNVFIAMLVSCLGILLAEIIQIPLEGQTAETTVRFYRLIYFLFYLFLGCICFCWTLYAYYWFNGNKPSGKTTTLFAAGIFVEFLLLVINTSNGFIFSITADGKYVRGNAFIYYISFCYLYLVMAIVITAIKALFVDGKISRRDFILFLLFFLFPVSGPVVQYFFPELSLMGISEAFALLTVYVTVQQRTMAEYMIEKERYQEANKEYEKSIEEMLSASSDALCIFYLNLSENKTSEEQGKSKYISNILKGNTVDDLFIAISSVITEEDEKKNTLQILNRKELLKKYSEGITQIALVYHRTVDNGDTHLIKTYLTMLKNPTTDNVEAIAYSVDIDKQEKEEKVISAITNREYDYIALVDTTTKKIHYQYISEKAEATVHVKRDDYDEVFRSAFTKLYEPQDTVKHFERTCFKTVFEALKNHEEYSYAFPYVGNNGEILQKKLTYRYLDERKKEILFLRSDITEETRQEREHSEKLRMALQEAQHANAMKTEFLSNVSHDMRTPLNAILGYTDLAKKSQHMSDIQEYLGKLDKAGKILLSLINDTLDLSKIENGAVTLKCEATGSDELISKIVTAIQPLAEEKEINFIVDTSRAVLSTINIDSLRVQEIFVNLLSNAVKFTPKKGTVTLTVECLKSDKNIIHDKITVSDNGCGMSKEFIPKAFEPFSQERQASTANIGGSGLGLSIVKKLVELMNGRIELQSELGKGTIFTVYLDFEQIDDKKEEETVLQDTYNSLRNKKILLVDDNEMNIEIAKTVLEMYEMKVSCAQNGQNACDLFEQSKPNEFDAILMDVRMPVMNGHEASKKIRQMKRPDAQSVPIIAMSADAFDEDIKESLAAGMNEHIAKPVEPEKIYKVLAKLIK